jgi:hypothetical protein
VALIAVDVTDRAISRSTGRSEVTAAITTDQVWSIRRPDDDGSNWYITHEPTGWELSLRYGTLPAARRAITNGHALAEVAAEVAAASTAPPVRHVDGSTSHDHAAAAAAWLDQHEPVEMAAARAAHRPPATVSWPLARTLPGMT